MKKIATDYIIKKINKYKLLNTLLVLVIFNLFEFFKGIKIIFVKLLYNASNFIYFYNLLSFSFLYVIRFIILM